MTPILKLAGLCLVLNGQPILDCVDLAISEGEIHVTSNVLAIVKAGGKVVVAWEDNKGDKNAVEPPIG